MAASTASMWFTSFSFLVHSRTSASASVLCMLFTPGAVGHREALASRVELCAQLGQHRLGVRHGLESVLNRPDAPPQRLHQMVELVQLVLQLFDLVWHRVMVANLYF